MMWVSDIGVKFKAKTNLILKDQMSKCSFFPQMIRGLKNGLPDSLISSAEMSDDGVSKFASLVRASHSP